VWVVFEVLINLLQAVLLLLFMKGRLHMSRRHKAHDALCILAVTAYLSAYLFYPVPFADTFVFLIPFIYALIAADDPWYVSAFWAAVLAVLFVSVISLSIHIFMAIPKFSYTEMMDVNGKRLILVLSTNGVLAVVVYAMSKLKKDYTAPYWPVHSLFLAAIVSLFIVAESLYALQMKLNEAEDTASFFLAYTGLLLCVMLFILLFQIMSKSLERENRYRAEAKAFEQSKQYQQELERVYNSLRTKKHDFKQHYQAMEQMMRRGSNEDADAYLASYRQSLDGNDFYLTGSTAVDALLYAKSLMMKQHGISFYYSPYSLDRLPINEPDFCAFIGNLLDNAIEGTLRVVSADSPLTIRLSFSRSWDMFYIYCSNPCNERTIRESKGAWRSSKEAEGIPGLHAIGIRSMEHIVRRAEGRSSFRVEGGMFNATIALPYSSLEAENRP